MVYLSWSCFLALWSSFSLDIISNYFQSGWTSLERFLVFVSSRSILLRLLNRRSIREPSPLLGWFFYVESKWVCEWLSPKEGDLWFWEAESWWKGTFFQGVIFILGNLLYSFMSYLGFISSTSSWDGVPKTLIISISWSICESARKGGCPLTISTRMHPMDHISIWQL